MHKEVKLHFCFVYRKTPTLFEKCEISTFRIKSHPCAVQVQIFSMYSVSGCCLPLEMTQWETVDKESDVKNPEVRWFFFFFTFKMKGVASCRGMPRSNWASSICGCAILWKNNCAAPYKEAVCTLITLLMLLWQAAVMGREVNAS